MGSTNVQKQREMFSLLDHWQQSGLDLRLFAESEGISFSKFKYWHRKWQALASTGFVELQAPLVSRFPGE